MSILENGDKEEINKLEPNFQSYYRKVKQMEIIIEKTNEYINKNRDYLSLFKMPVSLEVLEYELEKYEGMKSKDEKENEEMVEEMNKSF